MDLPDLPAPRHDRNSPHWPFLGPPAHTQGANTLLLAVLRELLDTWFDKEPLYSVHVPILSHQSLVYAAGICGYGHLKNLQLAQEHRCNPGRPVGVWAPRSYTSSSAVYDTLVRYGVDPEEILNDPSCELNRRPLITIYAGSHAQVHEALRQHRHQHQGGQLIVLDIDDPGPMPAQDFRHHPFLRHIRPVDVRELNRPDDYPDALWCAIEPALSRGYAPFRGWKGSVSPFPLAFVLADPGWDPEQGPTGRPFQPRFITCSYLMGGKENLKWAKRNLRNPRASLLNALNEHTRAVHPIDGAKVLFDRALDPEYSSWKLLMLDEGYKSEWRGGEALAYSSLWPVSAPSLPPYLSPATAGAIR